MNTGTVLVSTKAERQQWLQQRVTMVYIHGSDDGTVWFSEKSRVLLGVHGTRFKPVLLKGF
jgi:hypothetical protein